MNDDFQLRNVDEPRPFQSKYQQLKGYYLEHHKPKAMQDSAEGHYNRMSFDERIA